MSGENSPTEEQFDFDSFFLDAEKEIVTKLKEMKAKRKEISKSLKKDKEFKTGGPVN